MGIFLVIIGLIAAIIYINYKMHRNKLSKALAEMGSSSVSEKYKTVFTTIMDVDLFFQDAKIINISKIHANIFSESHKNTIVNIYYHDCKLNIEWKYMMYHQTTMKRFSHDAASLNIKEQEKFALDSFEQMQPAILKLQSRFTEFAYAKQKLESYPIKQIIKASRFIDKNKNGTVTDIDGNVYHTVAIGTQVWMVENLKVTHYRNGTPITYITDDTQWGNITTGAYCDYENKPNYSKIYGNLYNWYAVKDERNIAPTGWHVPTNDEWLKLINYLGGDREAGGKLKENYTNHWNAPNLGATNERGFSALPGGNRSGISGIFSLMRYYGSWWSSTEVTTPNAYYWEMYHNNSNVYRGNTFKEVGYSIRCVRDN